MQVSDYKKSEIESMKHLSIVSSEGDIYLYQNKIIKRIRRINGDYFSNKLFTIHALADNEHLKEIEELVLPKKLITMDKVAVGYQMPYIEGPTLEECLKSSEFDIDFKIDLLMQVGTILEKMKNLREKYDMLDFFLNDLHECNFVLDIHTGLLHVVDLDSCSINGNLKFGAKYLSFLTPLSNFSKYKNVETFSCGADFIPSKDTDYYCYAIILLNFLSGINFSKLSLKDAYEYFNYLSSLKISKELVDGLAKIYSSDANTNIKDLIPYIKGYESLARVRKAKNN